jgi:large subunit ribosomal protein L21
MKKAVISTGGKQYLVSEGDSFNVEKIKDAGKTASFVPLMVIDGDKVHIGKPELSGASVKVDITEAEIKAEKVTSIRYKAKKRVKKVRGHRQLLTSIKVQSISVK